MHTCCQNYVTPKGHARGSPLINIRKHVASVVSVPTKFKWCTVHVDVPSCEEKLLLDQGSKAVGNGCNSFFNTPALSSFATGFVNESRMPIFTHFQITQLSQNYVTMIRQYNNRISSKRNWLEIIIYFYSESTITLTLFIP